MDVPSYAGMGLKARKCRILLSWNLLKEIFYHLSCRLLRMAAVHAILFCETCCTLVLRLRCVTELFCADKSSYHTLVLKSQRYCSTA